MSSEFLSFFESLSETERLELLMVPFFSAALVGNASDGELDLMETAKYSAVMSISSGIDEDYDRMRTEYDQKLGVFGQNFLGPAVSDGQIDPQKAYDLHSQLRTRVKSIIERMPKFQHSYRVHVLDAMLVVASASGGGLLGKKQKIDDDELANTCDICQQLGIGIADCLIYLQSKNFSY